MSFLFGKGKYIFFSPSPASPLHISPYYHEPAIVTCSHQNSSKWVVSHLFNDLDVAFSILPLLITFRDKEYMRGGGGGRASLAFLKGSMTYKCSTETGPIGVVSPRSLSTLSVLLNWGIFRGIFHNVFFLLVTTHAAPVFSQLYGSSLNLSSLSFKGLCVCFFSNRKCQKFIVPYWHYCKD